MVRLSWETWRNTWSSFVAQRCVGGGRQRMDQGGCFLAEEASAWYLFSWQACAERAGSPERSKQYDFEKAETFATPSGGIRGQDVCRAVYSWGSIGCCQMFPGEATVLLQAVSSVCYRQCSLPSQCRKACLNIPNGFQETLLVCETLATMSYTVPCCRLSFAAWLMLSSAATPVLPRSLASVWFVGAERALSIALIITCCISLTTSSRCKWSKRSAITKPYWLEQGWPFYSIQARVCRKLSSSRALGPEGVVGDV